MLMKSVQINMYGGSEAIEINQNTPKPTLSSGKVLVSIKAAGVNPAHWNDHPLCRQNQWRRD